MSSYCIHSGFIQYWDDGNVGPASVWDIKQPPMTTCTLIVAVTTRNYSRERLVWWLTFWKRL